MDNVKTFDLTLFDDESTREKHTVMDKMEIMNDDSRNPELPFDIEEFFEWGVTYRFTIEKLSK